MFRKVHTRLTLLFALVSALIMTIMSALYLYVTEHNLYRSSQFSFENDANTIISNIEQQDMITYNWLSSMEQNNRYQISIYDNDVLLSFSRNHESPETLALFAAFRQNLKDAAALTDTSEQNLSQTAPRLYSYQTDTGQSYYVCTASFRRNASTFDICIFMPLDALMHQILMQRLIFIGIDFLALLALSLFAWYYTGKVLVPIRENQEKQTQFVASASHELRTPLAVILSSMSALHKADREEDRAHFLSVITSESQRMSRLIDDMLALASADNRSWMLQKKPVELDTLLLNCYEAFSAMASEKQISMSITLPDAPLPVCLCDANRIEQVITILLHNALSYGHPDGHVVLSISFQSGHFLLEIADDGPGIADHDKPHIFERFYRSSDANRQQEHFGLGLCIAKEIIDAHHGTLKVSDTPGGGTTFTITLTS